MTSSNESAGRTPRSRPESLRGRELNASITVNDLRKSLAWYRDVLGFTVEREIERNGSMVGVRLKAGTVGILLNQDDGAKGQRTKGEGFSLQIVTAQNVDDIAKRVRDAGWSLDSEPADMPWGARVFRLKDPDGFKWVISSAIAS